MQTPPDLPGWDDVPIVQILQDAFGIPAFLQNDSNACALVEWKYGAGRGRENMGFLTMSARVTRKRFRIIYPRAGGVRPCGDKHAL